MGHHLSLDLHKTKHMLFSPTAVVDSHSHPANVRQRAKPVWIPGNLLAEAGWPSFQVLMEAAMISETGQPKESEFIFKTVQNDPSLK